MNDFKVKPLNLEGTHYDYELSFDKTDSFAQRVLLVLNTWSNEFVYDTDKGVDYHTVMSENFNHKVLESFVLFTLKKQMEDFDTITEWKLEYKKEQSTAYISFIAHSVDGQTAVIDNYGI